MSPDRHHDHEELLDTAAAWVLGALPDDEARTFATHLESCPVCQAEVARQRAVVDLLPLAAPPARPSPALRERIMAQVTREAELLAASGPGADRVQRRSRWAWLPLGRPWLAATTAAAVLGVGVVAGLLASGGQDDPLTTSPVTMAGAASNGTGELVIRDDGAELRVRGVRAPARDRVYQAWVVRDGQPVPDRVFTVDRDGNGSTVLQEDLDGASAVLVTVEPAGGSATPTSEPVMSVDA